MSMLLLRLGRKERQTKMVQQGVNVDVTACD